MNKKYNIIYADPPWEYKESGGGKRGTAGLPYKTMTTKEICSINVQSICEDNCILFIWATFRKLQECLKVIESWDFEYYGLAFDWVKMSKNKKPCFGMGYYTRQNNEICLIGVKKEMKKRIKPIDRSVSCVLFSEREEHSKKPDIVRDNIIKICGDLPRVELFSRDSFKGWDSIGNEIDGKDIRDIIK